MCEYVHMYKMVLREDIFEQKLLLDFYKPVFSASFGRVIREINILLLYYK